MSKQPTITPETKAILGKMKLTEYRGHHIPDWTNPDSWKYWAFSAAITVVGLYGFYQCTQFKGPRGLFTIALLGVPITATYDRKHFDSTFKNFDYAKTIDELLEFSPMGRNAWYAALEENKQFQKNIKEKIKELEHDLNISKQE